MSIYVRRGVALGGFQTANSLWNRHSELPVFQLPPFLNRQSLKRHSLLNRQTENYKPKSID